MRRIRTIGAAIALFAALAVSSPALASPRGDDGDFGRLVSKIKHVLARVVRTLDDIRSSIPP